MARTWLRLFAGATLLLLLPGMRWRMKEKLLFSQRLH